MNGLNHWQLVSMFIGRIVGVYNGRRVRITGCSVPGNAFCESVDGKGPIYEVSTAFLQKEAIQ